VSEFSINKYLSLKIEGGRTVIYVAGERFRQCKFLLLNILIKELKPLEELGSLDEIAEVLDNSLERPGEREDIYIEPKTEFWAHSSNLQVWYENNYDTRLLHRNLAFPLLHALTKAGDPVAKRVFKEEIATRLASGNDAVIKFLVNEDFIYFLDRDQYFMSILNPLEAESLLELEKFTGEYIKQKLLWEDFDTGVAPEARQQFILENKSIVALLLYRYNKSTSVFPSIIQNFKNLKVLRYYGDNIPNLPNNINKLQNLKEFDICSENLIVRPDSIINLPNLEYLRIRSPYLESIPEVIGKLKELKILSVGSALKEIPCSFKGLKKLEYLYINNNQLSHIPEFVYELEHLKLLDIEKNNIIKIPDNICELINLENLNIKQTNIKNLPSALLKINSLKSLFIESELIKRSENIIKKLKKKGVKVF